jgi:hypothetical protein
LVLFSLSFWDENVIVCYIVFLLRIFLLSVERCIGCRLCEEENPNIYFPRFQTKGATWRAGPPTGPVYRRRHRRRQ